MAKTSAGLLLYKVVNDRLLVLLGHPGGPYWANKDEGAWTIPKGEVEPGEEPIAAAHRELSEETGFTVTGEPVELGSVRVASGKNVFAWAIESDVVLSDFCSKCFSLEWPPGTGVMTSFPEIDRVGWFSMPEAQRKIHPSQHPFLDKLQSCQRSV